jgi:hypothetical protein
MFLSVASFARGNSHRPARIAAACAMMAGLRRCGKKRGGRRENGQGGAPGLCYGDCHGNVFLPRREGAGAGDGARRAR